MSLTLSIYPGMVPIGMQPGDYMIDEPLTANVDSTQAGVGNHPEAEQASDGNRQRDR